MSKERKKRIVMEWNTLLELVLNSIQIIGIFIAIIIGLIISKVMDLKKEKSEIKKGTKKKL